MDIHLDNSPVFQYKKYAGQSGTQGKWTNLTAGFDITAHPAPLAGAQAPAQQAPLQAPVQVLTVNFTEAAHVQRLVKGMRRSGLIPVLVDNARGQAPSQWHHDRSNRRFGRSMLGSHAVSSDDATVISAVRAKFDKIWAWTSLGRHRDTCPSAFFRMPCAQCGRHVTVFKACKENGFFPLMSLADGDRKGEEHVVCIMARLWEQDTPCSAVAAESTQQDCKYAPQGHESRVAQQQAMAAMEE